MATPDLQSQRDAAQRELTVAKRMAKALEEFDNAARERVLRQVAEWFGWELTREGEAK